MKRMTMVALAAAAVSVGACKNGPNNSADTTGMTNGSAAGSLSNGSAGLPDSTGSTAGRAPAGVDSTPLDTTHRDTAYKKKSPRPY